MGDYIENVDHDADTMAELYESAGYDLDELQAPRNVSADDVTEDTAVVAYTVTKDGYQLVEWDAELFRDDADVFQDCQVQWPAEEITHVLKWSYENGEIPKAEAIGFGDAFMDFYEKHDKVPPNSYRRSVSAVRAMSDDFIRVRL